MPDPQEPLDIYLLVHVLRNAFKAAEHIAEARRLLRTAEQSLPFDHPAKLVLSEQFRLLYIDNIAFQQSSHGGNGIFLSLNRVIEALQIPIAKT